MRILFGIIAILLMFPSLILAELVINFVARRPPTPKPKPKPKPEPEPELVHRQGIYQPFTQDPDSALYDERISVGQKRIGRFPNIAERKFITMETLLLTKDYGHRPSYYTGPDEYYTGPVLNIEVPTAFKDNDMGETVYNGILVCIEFRSNH